MGRILNAQVAAITKDWQVICIESTTREELEKIKEDQIITWPFINDNHAEEMFFCDRCKKRL
jgi:hypothetical protein